RLVSSAAPRPALGYGGVDGLTGQESGENRDGFIENRSGPDGQFSFVDQSKWLESHSGMRIPSQEIFEKSYIDGVMRPIQQEGTGFGGYT
ncbi:hypothetical protein CF392_15985, partial [Tamilnaduibacter salinus]